MMAVGMVASVVLAAQQTPRVVRQYESGQGFSYRVAFGGNGRWLAEGAAGPVRIFNIETGQIIRTLSLPNVAFSAFATHPSADVIALGAADGTVVAFDVATGSELWRTAPLTEMSFLLPGHFILEFSADGAELHGTASAMRYGLRVSAKEIFGSFFRRRSGASEDDSLDVFIRRWSAADGRELDRRQARGGSAASESPAHTIRQARLTSADGARHLMVLSMQGWLVIEARTGSTVFKAPPSTPAVFAWALSPDGQRVATVQRDILIVGELGEPVRYRYGNRVNPESLVTLQQMEEARRDALNGVESLSGTAERVNELASQPARPSAAFTRDNRWFVARATDGRIDLWDAATGNHMPFRLDGPQNNRDYATAQMPIVVRPRRGVAVAEGWNPVEIDFAPVQAAFGPATSRLLCRSQDGRFIVEEQAGDDGYATAVFRDADEGRTIGDLLQMGLDLSAGCKLSTDGNRIVVAGAGRAVKVKTIPKRTYAEGLFFRETSLVVFDLTIGRTVASLKDRRTKQPGRFPFSASMVEWSFDDQFVVGGGSGMPGIVTTGPLRAWNTINGDELDLASVGLDQAKRLRFLPGTADLLVLPEGQPFGETWNLNTLTRRLTNVANLPAADAASNGRVTVAPTTEGFLEIRRLASGELIGELGVFRGGEWLVTTPSGLFDGSPGGWQRLAWRTSSGIETAPGELFFSEFYQPGLLAELLEGRLPRSPVAIDERDRRQPIVTITASQDSSRMARVRLEVKEIAPTTEPRGSGARDLRLFRNGSLVKTWRGDLPLRPDGTVQVEASVPLVSGANQFTAYTFNRDNIKSLDASAVLRANVARQAATVYVLAIGVDRYTNPEFNLRYAVADAQAFATEVGAKQRGLGLAASIQLVTLLDGEATRANILLALARLAGTETGALPNAAPVQLGHLQAAQPEDTVILYFAGHGLAHGDRFHLIPADMSYRGPRNEAASALPQLLDRSVSDVDLEHALEPLNARHLALIIDACQSGQALGTDEARFGPMNSRGLAQLAYEKGMFILAASQAYQAALESAQLGHGYLTFALVKEALDTNVADRTPTDGAVTIDEWFAYAVRRVPQLQSEALDRARQEGRELRFDISAPQPGESRLQTPRVFTKRDASGEPFVIARP